MHPQAGELGRFSHHICGGLGRLSLWTEGSLVLWVKGPVLKTLLDPLCLILCPQLMGALSSQGVMSFVTPVDTEGTVTGL